MDEHDILEKHRRCPDCFKLHIRTRNNARRLGPTCI